MIAPPEGDSENAASFDPAHDNVFARIAGRYDLLCDIFSLFIHRHWKSRMARRMADATGPIMLDVASGTGDIPARFLRHLVRRRGNSPSTLWVTDVCPEMLALAKAKLAGVEGVRFAHADAHDLKDIADASIDVYSVSFGMKICDRHRAAAEAFRVLKPGGRFFCVEAARIPYAPLHWFYLRYMNWCLPVIARIVVKGDAGAYDYLLRGIHEFPPQEHFAAELREHGFENVSYENLTFGIVAIHVGTKPASA